MTLSRASILKVMLLCGVMQITAYYVAGTLATPGRQMPVPQPDTLLYCQSARQICEGQPFVFTPGDKPSTGCTSHLYPFVLAVPYALGMKGDALFSAGFVLNALFYLLFLFNWGIVADKLVRSEGARLLACALVCLSGHAAYCALAQSDIGFFMAVSSSILAAFLTGHTLTFAFLLAVSPWCRPEGMMLSLAYAAVLAVRRFWPRAERPRVGEWGIAALAAVSSLGVFAFNQWLTGMPQFHSVYYKGFFKILPFFFALEHATRDVMRMALDFFLGMANTAPREFILLPLFGALLGWAGVLRRDWTRAGVWRELVWLLAVLMSIASVALSGWQNTNIDRYLAWVFPIWLVYIAEGTMAFCGWLRNKTAAAIVLCAVLGFQAFSAFSLVPIYNISSLTSQREYDFAKDAAAVLPKGAKIGGSLCGLAYAWPGHRFIHLPGIYSPGFLALEMCPHLDKFKHEPSERPDIWLLSKHDESAFLDAVDPSLLCGKTLALGPENSVRLCEPRWAALDNALLPSNPPRGKALADSLDVGYAADEKRCGYTVESRFFGMSYAPFAVSALCGTNMIADVGDAVIGWETMRLALRPRKDATFILRTLPGAACGVKGSASAIDKLEFKSPLKLRVRVDGTETGVYELPMSETNHFSEVSFTVPGSAITRRPSKVEVFGDHLSFGWWVYQ